MVVTHKKGSRASNMFAPAGKRPWGCRIFSYEVRFTDSCLYPPLPVNPLTGQDENSSWNKLPYVGAFNPHREGVNFGWRHYDGKLELSARVYHGEDKHLVLWHQEILPNVDYKLEHRRTDNGVGWWMDGHLVAIYNQKIPFRWLSGPWFGGGPGLWFQGNTPQQDITLLITI